MCQENVITFVLNILYEYSFNGERVLTISERAIMLLLQHYYLNLAEQFA